MRKILFYCPDFYPNNSGYANAFFVLITTLIEENKDIFIKVLTPYPLGKDNKELNLERVEVLRLKKFISIPKIRVILNQFYFAKKASKIFKKEKFDLLFVETFEDPIFLSFLDRDIYNNLVVRVHATAETEWTYYISRPEFIMRRIFIKFFLKKRIKWFLSTNSYHIDFVKKFYFQGNKIEIGNKNFFILPNPIKPFIEEKDIKVNKRMKIFMLGRMDDLGFNQKGFVDFLYAFRLLPENIREKFEVLIVGKGEKYNLLRSAAEGLKNIKIIEKLKREEVINNLIDSDICLLPSRYEGLSLFALEGLAAGNICLFPKKTGLVDMLDGNGFLFEPQNIEDLAEKLRIISNLEKNEIIHMKKRSLKICKEKFSPEKVSDTFNKIYSLIKFTSRLRPN